MTEIRDDGPLTMSGALDRRLIGSWLIVLAAVALLVVSRLSGRDIDGAATAVPPLPVPAAGSCLVQEPATVDGQLAAADPVPCAAAHTAEVQTSWAANDPAAPEQDQCPVADFQYADTENEIWSAPTLVYSSVLLRVGGPIGWVACITMPASDLKSASGPSAHALRWTGPVAGFADVSKRPIELRACYLAAATDRVLLARADCRTAHASERLGNRYVSDPRGILQSCAQLAHRLVGSDRPFADGSLLAIAEPDNTVNPSGHDYYCSIVSGTSRPLVDSVMGLGDAAVPFG